MKIPIPERVVIAAKEYAEKSHGFTHDHAGWEDKKSKAWRLLFGKVAELSIVYFLKLNEKDVIEDASDFTQNDSFDFLFRLKKYDVKTSYTKDLPICITRTYEGKDIDFFVGTRIDFYLKYIEILGVIESEKALNQTYYVKHEQQISETKYNCTFKQGAYFFTGTYDNFFEHFEFDNEFISMPAEYFRRLYMTEKTKHVF